MGKKKGIHDKRWMLAEKTSKKGSKIEIEVLGLFNLKTGQISRNSFSLASHGAYTIVLVYMQRKMCSTDISASKMFSRSFNAMIR